MARIYKCDKCKKIIKKNDNFSISISDEPKLIKNNRGFISLDLCSKCSKPLAIYLDKFYLAPKAKK